MVPVDGRIDDVRKPFRVRLLHALQMTGDIGVREAGTRDVPVILAYVKKLAAFEGLADSVRATERDIANALFSRRIIRALIAERETVSGKRISMGALVFRYGFSTFSGKPNLYIEDLFVDPEYRRIGVARKLFDYLATIARDEGCERLEWAVLEWNDRAMNFYRSIDGYPNADWKLWKLDLD
jgi:GNAT superfamily N-acetyltransferase